MDVKVVPDLLQVIALRARLEDLDGLPVININDVPLQGFNSIVKRVIDIGISSAALVVLAVPLAIAAALVKLTSKGPVLFYAGAHEPGRQVVQDRQVPVDARRRGGRHRARCGRARTTRA